MEESANFTNDTNVEEDQTLEAWKEFIETGEAKHHLQLLDAEPCCRC